MAFIKINKPTRPLMFTGLSATFNVYGKSFYEVTNVYLSGAPYPQSTLQNPFSGVQSLSGGYPQFTAIKLLSSEYSSNNQNIITLTAPSAVNPGNVDIIVQNDAGYGTLTQYVIKELYSGDQTLKQLRPWSDGITVLLSAG